MSFLPKVNSHDIRRRKDVVPMTVVSPVNRFDDNDCQTIDDPFNEDKDDGLVLNKDDFPLCKTSVPIPTDTPEDPTINKTIFSSSSFSSLIFDNKAMQRREGSTSRHNKTFASETTKLCNKENFSINQRSINARDFYQESDSDSDSDIVETVDTHWNKTRYFGSLLTYKPEFYNPSQTRRKDTRTMIESEKDSHVYFRIWRQISKMKHNHAFHSL